MTSNDSQRIHTAIDLWRRRLLDLTRRNRLLYFKPSRAGSLDVFAPDIYELIDELDYDGEGWDIHLPEEQPEEDEEHTGDVQPHDAPDALPLPGALPISEAPAATTASESTEPAQPAAPTDAAEEVPEALPEPVIPDGPPCLVFREPRRAHLQRRLLHLMRRSRSDLEDRGVHVLYMAVGIFEWTESPSHPPVRSPLLLFPVELQRPSLFGPWRLVPSWNDEITVNPALMQRLAAEGTLLPELPPPDEADRAEGGELCRLYFEKLRASLPQHPDRPWRIIEEAWLDLFSFHKLVMFKDLEQNAERAATHPLVRRLAGLDTHLPYPGRGGAAPVETVEAESLDDSVDPRQQVHVLDADSSQMAVLETVRRGGSVVLQGPPGTGKSQTITNIIAQALADGLSVLFVSEKMAALEVVKRRLELAHLGEVCLELHSHQANRRDVVQQLARSLEQRPEPDRAALPDEHKFDRLLNARRELNTYIRELHACREPMGRSVAQVLAELAMLADAPMADAKLTTDAIASLDGQAYSRFIELVERLEARFEAVRLGPAFPWWGVKPTLYSGALQAQVEAELKALNDAASALQQQAETVGAHLGIAPPSPAAARHLLALLLCIERSPGIPPGMLEGHPPIGEVVAEGRRISESWDKARRLEQQVLGPLSTADARLPAPEMISRRRHDLLRALQPLGIDPGSPAHLIRQHEHLMHLQRALEKAAEACRAMMKGVGLQQPEAVTLRLVRDVAGQAGMIARGTTFEECTLSPAGLVAAQRRLRDRRPVLEKAVQLRDQAAQFFHESFLKEDPTALEEEYKLRSPSILRHLSPAWYALNRRLTSVMRDRFPSAQIPGALALAREAWAASRDVAAGLADDQAAWGAAARGLQTNLDELEETLERASDLLHVFTDRPLPTPLTELLTTGLLQQPRARAWCEALVNAAAAISPAIQALGAPGLEALVETAEGGLDAMAARLREAAEVIADTLETLAPLRPALTANLTWEQLEGSIAARLERQSLEDRMRSFGELHGHRLGRLWNESATDWEHVSAVARHGAELADLAAGAGATVPPLPPDVIEAASLPGRNFDARPALEAAIARYDGALRPLAQRFETGCVPAGNRPIDDARWPTLAETLSTLAASISNIDTLNALQSTKRELETMGLMPVVQPHLRPDLHATTAGRAMRRTLLQAWLDHQWTRIPALEQFRGDDHQALIARFVQLDLDILKAGPHRVLDRLMARPQPGTLGEARVIRREAAKKSRHIPLRRMFAEAPSIVTRLRPCLLMSPLSVAQFLKDSPVAFDLVVFDEASQIFTEDAIGAIMRGSQVVVCGDDRQLPPTSFFQATEGYLDDSPADDPDAAAADYESVLKACAGALAPAMLRWHYRSRHEALIAFSNRHFYESRLITFPSAMRQAPSLGVQFVHVPEGCYNRGTGSKKLGPARTNTPEADRLVELVVQHWRHRPTETLGVVTLSQAQMDRVIDRLEDRIRREPDLERFYSATGYEPFFVKNLENVQGDERDHIILGIGYGRDASGRLTMNFGPLNRNGGERRLNVAVTRARRCVTLVASLTHLDFSLTEATPAGVRLLRDYLEYAATQNQAPSATAGTTAGAVPTTGHMLEASVAAVLAAEGFETSIHLGASALRVGVAAARPEHPEHYLMGVETDGPTALASPTARDRDRLRPSVLKGYGWKLHQLYAPDWVRHRQREEHRLIAAARQAAIDASQPAHPPTPPQLPPATPAPEVENDGAQTAGAAQPTDFSPHEPAPASESIDITESTAAPASPELDMPIPQWAGLFTPAQVVLPSELKSMAPPQAPREVMAHLMAEVALHENGVERERVKRLLRDAWGIARLGAQINRAFDESLALLERDPSLVISTRFILPQGYAPKVRLNPPGTRLREFREVPAGEIALAARHLLEENGRVPLHELARHIAHLYGCAAGTRTMRWIQEVMDDELNAGRLCAQTVHTVRILSLP